QTAAEARSRQRPLQRNGETAANHDDEQAITADSDTADLEARLEERGQANELLLRAEEIIDRCNRHEDEADREQNLVEMRPAIKRPVQRRLENGAQQRGEDECEREARE